jgi:hypothetical protein
MRISWMPPAPGEVGLGSDKWCVNHKDGNKLNSHISNLEWTTNGGNARHAWANGLQSYGEAKKNAKFTSRRVTFIRLRVKYGESAYSISKELNVAHGTIKKICRFESWRHQDKIYTAGSGWKMYFENRLENILFGEKLEPASSVSKTRLARYNGIVI